MLWGRSANRCAIPECRKELVADDTETDDLSIVGDEAHIVAREKKGPRGTSALLPEERDLFNNLILLCKNHHKQVDDQEKTYTVKKLHEIKEAHLRWISTNLSNDIEKQRDDEIYASYIDNWIKLSGINNWKAWTSWMLSGGQPTISRKQYDNLRELNLFLLSRVWPKRYPAIENAFRNFRAILGDLLNVFDKYKEAREENSDHYNTEKFYKRLQNWDPPAYKRLGDKYDFHIDLVQDLVCELTRSGNYTCDTIRSYVSHSFRISEGILLIETGPDHSLSYNTIRLEYSTGEESYQGLKNFMDIRSQRAYYFGQGISDDY